MRRRVLNSALHKGLSFAGGEILQVIGLITIGPGIVEFFNYLRTDKAVEKRELCTKPLVTVSCNGPLFHGPTFHALVLNNSSQIFDS